MALLEMQGIAGYHLVSFGVAHLVVEHSDRKWEHKRVTALRTHLARAELENDGWTYVGSWYPFHYFKRPLP